MEPTLLIFHFPARGATVPPPLSLLLSLQEVANNPMVRIATKSIFGVFMMLFFMLATKLGIAILAVLQDYFNCLHNYFD